MRLILALAALPFLSHPVLAQVCSFTMPNVNFGTIDVTSNVNFNTSVTFTASCTGNPNTTVRICPNFNNGSSGASASGNPRYLLAGTSQANFNIFRNAAYTNVWGSFTWGKPPTPPVIAVNLNGAGTGSVNRAVRLRVPSGQTALPPGIYTTSFAGAETRVNYAYSTVGNCSTISSLNRNPTQTPFTVTAQLAGGCVVTATDVDFGTQTLLNTALNQTGTISVRCPISVPYTIGLDGGTSAATDPANRLMSNGVDTIAYGIYQDATHTAPWGNTIGTNTVASTGTGSNQNFTAYLRIPPQTTPPADVYDDSIVVTVTY